MEFTHSLKMNYGFRRVYNKGKSSVQPCLVVYCRKNGGSGNSLGVTVSAKLGHAVTRNRIRRRLREIYRLSESAMAVHGYDIVIVARGRAAEAEYSRLEREYLRACRELRLMEGKK